ncbi:oligosaccharide repeat unit polymerase [Vibrio alginolyticus]
MMYKHRQANSLHWLVLSNIMVIAFAACMSLFSYDHLLSSLYLLSLLIVVVQLKSYFRMLDLSFWFISCYLLLFYINPIYSELLNVELFDVFGLISRQSFIVFSYFTIVSIHIFLFFSSICGRVVKNRYENKIVEYQLIKPEKLTRCLMILTLSIFLLIASDVGLSFIFSLTRGELRESRGGLSLLALYLAYATLPLIFLSGYVFKKHSNYKILILVLFLDVFLFVIFRIRTFILAHLICFLGGILVSGNISLEYTYRKLVLLFPLLIFIAIFVRFFRGYYELYGFWGGLQEVDVSLALYESIILGDLGYSPVVMRLFDTFPDTINFLHGDSYMKLIYSFLPKFISGDRIVDTQALIGAHFYPYLSGMTLPPGVQGDAYINFGYYGLLIFSIYGIVFPLSRLLNLNIRIILFFSMFTTIFHFVRGAFANPVLIFIVIVISCFFFSYYLGFKVRINDTNNV